jgi:hypothetical protein
MIHNVCADTVTIHAGWMAAAAGEGPGSANCPGTAPCPEFSVVSGIPSGTRITQGNSVPVTFALRYQPINTGPDVGAFVISHSEGSRQPLDTVVHLKGRGEASGVNVDTFALPAQQKADVLLVIDDSCSMADHQVPLTQNMGAFLRYATAQQIDFHLAVTNTEATLSDRGKFCGASAGTTGPCPRGNKVLTASMPNLVAAITDLSRVGTSGSSESCMDPAAHALTAPFIADPAANGGFLRRDATLSVVCITDGSDQAPWPPLLYLNLLNGIKGAQSPGPFTYNVMGPFIPTPPSGCAYGGNRTVEHDLLVEGTNGVKGDICTPDWPGTLERLGKVAMGYRTDFFLVSRPDLSASSGIEVRVNGALVPAVDSVGGVQWSYDVPMNAIRFEPLLAPTAGQTLTVTYPTACLP